MSGYLFNVAFRGRGSISNDCRDIYLTATPVMCPERVSSYTISSALLCLAEILKKYSPSYRGHLSWDFGGWQHICSVENTFKGSPDIFFSSMPDIHATNIYVTGKPQIIFIASQLLPPANEVWGKVMFLPPANEVCEGYVFTGVRLSTGGGACMSHGTHAPPAATHGPPSSQAHPPGSHACPPGSHARPPGSHTCPPAAMHAPPSSQARPSPGSHACPPSSHACPPAATHAPPAATHPPGSHAHPPGSHTHPPGSHAPPPQPRTPPPASSHAHVIFTAETHFLHLFFIFI